VHRAGVAAGGDLPGAVDTFADAGAIGDADAVFGERRGNRHVVDLLEATGALALERAGAGHEDHWRALAPGLHHGRHGVGETLGPNQAHRRLAGDPRVRIGQVAGHLFMRAIDDPHAAFHEPFECRIAESAGQREHMLHALLQQGARQYVAAAQFAFVAHRSVSSGGCVVMQVAPALSRSARA